MAFVTWVLYVGVRESATTNAFMVALKIGILLFFMAVGAFWIRPENWTPFAPNGWAGISAGAAIIFFAYIGFDAVSTAAEEARAPQRDMPRAIIAALIITTLLYILVTLVMTGLLPWREHGTADPLASALATRGYEWAAGIVAIGAVAAMASVLLVFQLGQSRIFFSMGRDGLLPGWASRVHPRYKTPHMTTVLTGLFVAFFAAFADIHEVIELTNIGTLFAFVLVSLGVIVLRFKEPERVRPFRVPWVPITPLISIAACIYLMIQLPWVTWVRFGLWLAAGLVIYFVYSMGHSRLRGRARS